MKLSVREMCEMGMLVALAIILDLPFLKIRIGQNGGSISLTMLPLFVLAIRHGPLKGFIGCGIVYGLITCLIDGWGFSTYPFDYLLAYGSIGIAGLFKNKILKNDNFIRSLLWCSLAVLLGSFGRFISSSISSVIFYELSFPAALVYNIAYIGPAAVITLDIFIILLKPLIRVNERFPIKRNWINKVIHLSFKRYLGGN